jgi:SAM-dependent methyltransferase
MATATNDEQHDYWNRAGGERWVAHQAALDEMVRPFGRAALARLSVQQGEHVLDVGCGCGDTLLELGRLVGGSGSVTGIDLSAPMLARARERAPFATLLQGDATTQTFARRFDALYSRLGVMFFSEPVGAFRQLAGALRAGGRMAFVCWRTPAENPWVTLPVEAGRAVRPDVVFPWQDDPESPGPFSFGTRERIVAVLRAAGLATVDVQAFDSEVVLSQTGLAAAVRFALTVGPGARLVVEATPEQRTRIEQALALAFAPHMRDDQLLLRGAAWVVAAQVA